MRPKNFRCTWLGHVKTASSSSAPLYKGSASISRNGSGKRLLFGRFGTICRTQERKSAAIKKRKRDGKRNSFQGGCFMTSKFDSIKLNRRSLLKTAALAGAAQIASPY